jgi:hypothetical protein
MIAPAPADDRTRIRVTPDGAVCCEVAIPLPVPANSAWGQIRDFHRFASHDRFHTNLQVAGGVPRGGAALRMGHRFGPVCIQRVGRILWWREGVGFAFSDLSLRGPRHGFPHVFVLRVDPGESPEDCVVRVRVTGRWTADWMPLCVRRWWLAWVFAHVVWRTRADLFAFAAARRRRLQRIGRPNPHAA